MNIMGIGMDNIALNRVGETGVVNPMDAMDRPNGLDPEDVKANRSKSADNGECQTCKNRKYQDGSNENVSYKSPTRISPEAAAGAVRAHEGEHVANAYSKAAQKGGKVIQASVAIHTAVCPECGKTYVAGGETTTKIKYGNEKNPYIENLKKSDNGLLSGMNIDQGV